MGADYCVLLFCISVLSVTLCPSIVTCQLFGTRGKATVVKRPGSNQLNADVGSGVDLDELGSSDDIAVDLDYQVEQPYPGLSDFEGSGEDAVQSECQRLRKDQQIANIAGHHIVQCTSDGRFKPTQCNEQSKTCWCVDLHGRQVPGTTRRWSQKPDCTPTIGVTDRTDVNTKTVKPQHASTTQPPGSDIGFGSSSSDGIGVDIQTPWAGYDLTGEEEEQSSDVVKMKTQGVLSRPGILAAIIVGAVIVLLCLVMIVMFVVYRMRKKDEGSYALCEEPKQKLAQNMIREHHNASIVYTKAPANDECFA